MKVFLLRVCVPLFQIICPCLIGYSPYLIVVKAIIKYDEIFRFSL